MARLRMTLRCCLLVAMRLARLRFQLSQAVNPGTQEPVHTQFIPAFVHTAGTQAPGHTQKHRRTNSGNHTRRHLEQVGW